MALENMEENESVAEDLIKPNFLNPALICDKLYMFRKSLTEPLPLHESREHSRKLAKIY